jgi:hypothetical protein
MAFAVGDIYDHAKLKQPDRYSAVIKVPESMRQQLAQQVNVPQIAGGMPSTDPSVRVIQDQVAKIQPELNDACEQRARCCATKSPWCRPDLVSASGKPFSKIIRKLARRTRALLRNVEHRNEDRRDHEHTRETIRDTLTGLMRGFSNTLEVIDA